MRLILGFLMLFFNSYVYSKELASYKCEIKSISDSYDVKNLERYYLGQIFYVDRTTGEMSGRLRNDYVNKPIVIDLGSADNAFKVIGYLKIGEGMGRGSNLYALNIEEFVKNELKPFTYMDNSMVFRGYCT